MKEQETSLRRELRIIIIDDDPCALEHEASIASRVQNRDGCHIKIWPTTKLDAGIHRCLYSLRHPDVVIIDLSMNNGIIEPIVKRIRDSRPDIILIGITAHLDSYIDSAAPRQCLRCIIDKAKLNQELPRKLKAIYHEKTSQSPTKPLEPKRTIPPSHCTNRQTTQRRKQRDRKSRDPHCSSADDGSHQRQRTTAIHNDAAYRHVRLVEQTKPATKANTEIRRQAISDHPHDRIRSISGNLRNNSPYGTHLATTQEAMTAALHFPQKALRLSPAELRVINLCSQGMQTDEVADHLSISSNTVYSHRSHIMGKYHTHSWHEALTIYEQRKRNGTA
ncbi:response regulator transcription factor [Bifidobacterium sp. ESL0704]|uniref:response regulator transcription factor n=1 Tax=Bifidobacterium sp. ESL0704 TaxID=2983219 RepID=UPI0023F9C7E0|nr:response regulator transcription factor [Bifidobacterium sp. ESL0704]WEV53322.1 response regulator transcription factor [Bifidobacterium sp. ESL0704]